MLSARLKQIDFRTILNLFWILSRINEMKSCDAASASVEQPRRGIRKLVVFHVEEGGMSSKLLTSFDWIALWRGTQPVEYACWRCATTGPPLPCWRGRLPIPRKRPLMKCATFWPRRRPQTADEMTKALEDNHKGQVLHIVVQENLGLWLSMPGTRGLNRYAEDIVFENAKKIPPCHATGPLRSGKMSLKPYFTMALLNQCVAVAGKVAGEIPLDPPR